MSRIIVIEESNLTRIRIGELLGQIGYNDVIYISSADSLLSKADLILKDVRMIITETQLVGTSSFELTRILRNDRKYSQIPVIFATDKADIQTINDAFLAGAVDFIVKPFEDSVFIDRIKKNMGVVKVSNNSIDRNKIIDHITLENERAIRGNTPLGFIKLTLPNTDMKNHITVINSVTRRIDTVSALDSSIIITCPLTDKNGLEFVFNKVQMQLEKFNMGFSEKELVTFSPDGTTDYQIMVKNLDYLLEQLL